MLKRIILLTLIYSVKSYAENVNSNFATSLETSPIGLSVGKWNGRVSLQKTNFFNPFFEYSQTQKYKMENMNVEENKNFGLGNTVNVFNIENEVSCLFLDLGINMIKSTATGYYSRSIATGFSFDAEESLSPWSISYRSFNTYEKFGMKWKSKVGLFLSLSGGIYQKVMGTSHVKFISPIDQYSKQPEINTTLFSKPFENKVEFKVGYLIK